MLINATYKNSDSYGILSKIVLCIFFVWVVYPIFANDTISKVGGSRNLHPYPDVHYIKLFHFDFHRVSISCPSLTAAVSIGWGNGCWASIAHVHGAVVTSCTMRLSFTILSGIVLQCFMYIYTLIC